MEQGRVLIVSDSQDRKNFLEFHVRKLNLRPIWYPNILAARMAIKSDPFVLVLVDLGIPVEPKLAFIKDCLNLQPHIPVISIGKTDYLSKERPLPELPHMVCLPAIELAPGFMRQWFSRPTC